MHRQLPLDGFLPTNEFLPVWQGRALATAWTPQRARVDGAMVKAIARGHRWRRLIESGKYASITDLAAEKSYVFSILRLTLLARPRRGNSRSARQPTALQLPKLLKSFPVEWMAKKKTLGLTDCHLVLNPRKSGCSRGQMSAVAAH